MGCCVFFYIFFACINRFAGGWQHVQGIMFDGGVGSGAIDLLMQIREDILFGKKYTKVGLVHRTF